MFAKFKSENNKRRGVLEVGELKEKNFSKLISFELIANLPIIEVEIQNEKYKFLFDTAALSVVPQTLVQKLSLEVVAEIDINDSQDKLESKALYTLPSLKIAGLEFCDYVAVSEDFSQYIPFSCLGFDGILGYNFLRSLVVKLDYKNQEIELCDSMPSHKAYAKMPLLFDGHSGAKFEMQFAFRHITFTLDTGKNDAISLSKSDERSAFNEYGYEKRETHGLFMSSFNTKLEHTKETTYLVKEFRITKHIEIEQYPVSLNATSHNLVGTDFLNNFDIIVDFRKKYLYLKQCKNEIISKDFNDSFGFFMHWSESQKLHLSGITKDSPSDKAGLKIGNRILAIQDIDTFSFTKEEYCQMFLDLNSEIKTYESNETLELTIQNDTTIKKVYLKK